MLYGKQHPACRAMQSSYMMSLLSWDGEIKIYKGGGRNSEFAKEWRRGRERTVHGLFTLELEFWLLVSSSLHNGGIFFPDLFAAPPHIPLPSFFPASPPSEKHTRHCRSRGSHFERKTRSKHSEPRAPKSSSRPPFLSLLGSHFLKNCHEFLQLSWREGGKEHK